MEHRRFPKLKIVKGTIGAGGKASAAIVTRKTTNLQVAVAAETLAQYRAEHGL